MGREDQPRYKAPEFEPYDLALIDAKGIFYRAADAYDELSIPGNEGFDRMATGGIYGFMVMLTKFFVRTHNPMVIVCWDDWKSGPTARKKIFSDYKKRPPLHEQPLEKQDLISRMDAQQKGLIELLSKIGVRQAVAWGWEADDVMGTLAHQFQQHRVAIFSGDRDMFQCIKPTVHVIRPLAKGQFSVETEASVKTYSGVTPAQWIDYKALCGDTGDNIPGCSGIGPIKAAAILQAYNTLAAAYNSSEPHWLEKRLGTSARDKFMSQKEVVRMSWNLSRIRTDVELDFIPPTNQWELVKQQMLALRFFSLMKPSVLSDIKAMGGNNG